MQAARRGEVDELLTDDVRRGVVGPRSVSVSRQASSRVSSVSRNTSRKSASFDPNIRTTYG
ncbi:hypothetical protein P9139_00235 [Curtobacterium flaccumfaciens]|nr:hypothetical protein P9139_00235 [Curtobacterium flaccumfaciens]